MDHKKPAVSILEFAQAVLDNEWFVGFIRESPNRHWAFNSFLQPDKATRIAIHESMLRVWVGNGTEYGYKKISQVEDIVLLAGS